MGNVNGGGVGRGKLSSYRAKQEITSPSTPLWDNLHMQPLSPLPHCQQARDCWPNKCSGPAEDPTSLASTSLLVKDKVVLKNASQYKHTSISLPIEQHRATDIHIQVILLLFGWGVDWILIFYKSTRGQLYCTLTNTCSLTDGEGRRGKKWLDMIHMWFAVM